MICPLFPCLGQRSRFPSETGSGYTFGRMSKLRWLVRESKRRAHPGLPGAGGFRKRSEDCARGREAVSCVGKRPAKVYGGDAAADACTAVSLPTKLGQGKLTDADGQIVAA